MMILLQTGIRFKSSKKAFLEEFVNIKNGNIFVGGIKVKKQRYKKIDIAITDQLLSIIKEFGWTSFFPGEYHERTSKYFPWTAYSFRRCYASTSLLFNV